MSAAPASRGAAPPPPPAPPGARAPAPPRLAAPPGPAGPAGWSRAERRWLASLLAALLPPSERGLPGLGALDLAAFWPAFDRAAPRLLLLGLRAATWCLTWAGPVLFARRLQPFHHLDADARDRVLARADGSRSYLVRQLVQALKVVACFAWAADADARRALLAAAAGARPLP